MVEVDTQLDVLYGDERDAHIKEMREKAEAFFKQAGTDPCEVYRIEKFEPVKIDPEYHGKFYDGDSYVVLKLNDRAWDIHYWHGVDATSDEMGSSAALSVLLSNNLKLGSRHHLELMNEETDLFLSYWRSGIHYLHGGVDSGFKHVEPEKFEPRLLHVKGKRYPRVFTKEPKADNLNEGDCFVLDLGLELYYWAGEEANGHEKYKAMEVAVAIKNNDRKTKAKLFHPRDVGGEIEEKFWAALGGKPAKINAAIPDDAPPSASEEEMMKYSLFHISDASGKMETTEVTERPLLRSHLNDDDTYILELYDQVYVWQGKGASPKEKMMGVKLAKDFVTEKGKPKNTKIHRIPQGVEDATFKSFFDGFYPMLKEDFGKDKQGIDTSTTATQDVEKLAQQQNKAANLVLEKLGKDYTKTVYWLKDFKEPIKIEDPEEDGKFFAESCYIVDLKSSTHRYQINWQGPKLIGEQHAMNSEAMEIISEHVNTSDMTRIRVRKGHEDETFLRFFPHFCVLDEARVPMAEFNAKLAEKGGMFRVQAPYGSGARAIEQNERSSKYLNSGDAFVVFTPQAANAYVWCGLGASEVEIKAATEACQAFTAKPATTATFKENEETDDFWEALGGKGEYSTSKEALLCPGFEPRLYHVSNQSGYTFMKEVVAYAQEDLLNDDVYILDSFDKVYIWVGNRSNKFEKAGAYKKAEQYIAGVQDGRDKDEVTICEIDAGHEPFDFTAQFIQWEPEVARQWLDADPLAIMRKEFEAQEAMKAAEEAKDPFDGFINPKEKTFPYEELKSKFP